VLSVMLETCYQEYWRCQGGERLSMQSRSKGNFWRREGAWAQMHLPCQVRSLHHTSQQHSVAITNTSTYASNLQDGIISIIEEARRTLLTCHQSAQNSAGIQTLLDVRTTAHYDFCVAHPFSRPSEMRKRLSSKVCTSSLCNLRY
jgi:ABC-type uncharacterized transport system permease subunit